MANKLGAKQDSFAYVRAALNIKAEKIGKHNISTATKLVLIMLAQHRNSKTGQCNPSVKTLVQETGAVSSTVCLALKTLKDLSILQVKSRGWGNGHGQKTNWYALNLQAMQSLARPINGPSTDSTTSDNQMCIELAHPMDELAHPMEGVSTSDNRNLTTKNRTTKNITTKKPQELPRAPEALFGENLFRDEREKYTEAAIDSSLGSQKDEGPINGCAKTEKDEGPINGCAKTGDTFCGKCFAKMPDGECPECGLRELVTQ